MGESTFTTTVAANGEESVLSIYPIYTLSRTSARETPFTTNSDGE
jgi:hypothetical protein